MLQTDGVLTESELPYFPEAFAECGGGVAVVGGDWRLDQDSLRAPISLLQMEWDGSWSVVKEWADGKGRAASVLGCHEDAPVWVEFAYPIEGLSQEGSGREELVRLDAGGGMQRTALTDESGRPVTDLCTTDVRSWVRDRGLYVGCEDGRMQRIDLDSAQMTNAVDARDMVGDGITLAYLADDGVVMLALHWDTGDATLLRYDMSGRELDRLDLPGLAGEIADTDEPYVDFIAVDHPPSR